MFGSGSKRGAALLAALCLAAVFALCLTSYIALCYTSLKVSTRNLCNLHCIELAETGLEQALYSKNNNDWISQPWNLAGNTATLTQSLTPTSTSLPENGETWVFKVQVTNYGSSSPTINSWGIVTLPSGATVTTDMREMTLATTSAVAPVFVNAVAATSGSVTFSGAATVGSYSSNPYLGAGTAPGNFSAVVLSQNPSTVLPGVVLGSGTVIQGYVVGNNANSISYSITSVPIPSVVAYGDTPSTIDPKQLIVNPQPYQPQFVESNPAPGPGHDLGTVNLSAGSTPIGSNSTSTPQIYTADSMTLTNSAQLAVAGNVVLMITGSGGLTVSDTAQIYILPTGPFGTNGGPIVSLEIHIKNGAMTLGGNGIYTADSSVSPQAIAIMGSSNTSSLTIGDPSTNPIFYGVAYFPNASLTVVGNPRIYGALVANSITFTGNPIINYDTALRSPITTVGNPAFTAFYSSATTNFQPVAIGTMAETVPAAQPGF